MRQFRHRWRCRGRVLRLGEGPPAVMAILNCTPDSFSDGGRFASVDEVVAEARRLVEAGASILDVGGESTRPGAAPVEAAIEMERVVPMIAALRAAFPEVLLSVDTTKASVAEAALVAGTDIINDVSGLEHDPAMTEVAARYRAGVVVMHRQGTPASMQQDPRYGDVVDEVRSYLRRRTRELEHAGVASEAVCWDYGIGFGKTLAHNLALLGATASFAAEAPLLVGVSRKRWIGDLTDRPVEQRMGGSLAGACAVAERGAHVLRVHDVLASCDAMRIVYQINQASDAGKHSQP